MSRAVGNLANSSTAFGGAGASLLHGRSTAERTRTRLREADIQESRALLLELATQEPSIAQCFIALTNFCLSEDIELQVNKSPISDEFKAFVNDHYHRFCMEAVRCFYIYGFVPWHPRKLPSGDIVPCVLPHGMFTWSVATQNSENFRLNDGAGAYSRTVYNTKLPSQDKSGAALREDQARWAREGVHKNSTDKKKKPPAITAVGPEIKRGRWDHLPVPEKDADSKQLRYAVHVTSSNLDADDVFVHEIVQPTLNITNNSIMYATVHSPLSHILVDYKNLRDAQIRRAYADAWNTTARVFTSCQPPPTASNEPTQSYLYYETGTASSRINPGREQMQGRMDELERQISQPSNHVPALYNLPTNHRLEQLSNLTPCEDTNFLLEKYRRDVCNIIGVPFEMVFGRTGSAQANSTTAQADMSGRMFTNTVFRVCKQLEVLIKEVYCTIYEEDPVKVSVSLNPMPRLDIRSMEDLKILWEMGAVTPDVMAQLSQVLLISEKSGAVGKKRKLDHHPGEYISNLQQISKAQQPPKPPTSSAKKKKAK